MKHSVNCLDTEKLEFNFSQAGQKQVKQSKLFSALKRIWFDLLATLTKGNELEIWQTSDRFGNTWWHAYNPANGRSTTLATEAEMRVWIEESYHQ